MKGLILSLCDFTGNWSAPYAAAGYEVVRVDLQTGQDVRLLRWVPGPVHGILAAPPCTAFAKVGARFWESKGEQAILDGLAIVDACLRAVAIYRPQWWALENPAGRLKNYLGPAKWKFNPCDFGDPYTKLTYLWGHFTPPTLMFAPQVRNAVEPVKVLTSSGRSYDRTTWLGSARQNERSATPPGFSQAFFEANP